MAEAADRPADQSVAASIPEAPPPAGDDAPRVYSSVSIVAIIGLVVAVLYAATVGVGGLIALFHRAPYILPLWLFAVPVGAAAVCWAARARIRASEGALTGARLTTWGVGISAVVGLLYAAYYAGCYMAVTTQATRFMDDWFDKLKNDGLEQARKYQRKADENAPLDLAFLQTLKPPRPREDDRSLRDRLELEHDIDPMRRGGEFTHFRDSLLVHQFEDAGGDAKVAFLGVQGWGYDSTAGYTVDLSYRVTAGGVAADVAVRAVGVDVEGGERQWYALYPDWSGPPDVNPEAGRLLKLSQQAEQFAQAWLNQEVKEGRWDDAYLDTLPPAERTGKRAGGRGPDFEKGRDAFLKGALVRYDPGAFWVGAMSSDDARRQEQERKAGLVRDLFGKAPAALPPMVLDQPMRRFILPTYRVDGNRVRVAQDLDVSVSGLVFQTRLWLEAEVGPDEPVDEPSQGRWRVESIELVNGKTPVIPAAPPTPAVGPKS